MFDAKIARLMLLATTVTFLSGCVTPPRIDAPSSPAAALIPGLPPAARMNAGDPEISGAVADLMARASASADDTFDILSLSGGGARGAFGAGLLVGLTHTGQRPLYEIVTGVSAGALAAPFAFLGPDWDLQLTAAFSGAQPNSLLRMRGVAALFGPGVYSAEPLRDLVDEFVTMELIEAVARESRRGRFLLVQTTDLDAQSAVLWNMGKVAEPGNARARELFRDILLASASVPGVFPPVIFDVESDGHPHQEMHVDGGVISTFVLTPLIAAMRREGGTTVTHPGNLYLILNGPLSSQVQSTPRNTIQIVSRSFETSQMLHARASIAIVADFAKKHGLEFQFTFIPSGFDDATALDLTREEMTELFNKALEQPEAADIWWSWDELVVSDVLARRIDLEQFAPLGKDDGARAKTDQKELVN